MAATGAAGADRQLVADQLATTVGEDRRPFDKARPLLLAAFSREPSDAVAVCQHAAENRGVAIAGWIADCWVAEKMAPGRARQGPVCEESVPRAAESACEAVEGLEPGSPAEAGAGRESSAGADLTLISVRDHKTGVLKVKKEIPA